MYYSIWKAFSISHFLNVVSFAITTSAHLVPSYLVIIKCGYLENCISKVNREFPRSTDKRRQNEFTFFVFRYVIFKSIL